jgi:FAD/FMN-containing dehydrogenase
MNWQLRVLGVTRTPFAVKGGGHATNQGWSSTTGVHISTARFNQINYDKKTKTVSIGAGLIWDDVYDALTPHNVTVVGGRSSGVGVAGFTLGGGRAIHFMK